MSKWRFGRAPRGTVTRRGHLSCRLIEEKETCKSESRSTLNRSPCVGRLEREENHLKGLLSAPIVLPETVCSVMQMHTRIQLTRFGVEVRRDSVSDIKGEAISTSNSLHNLPSASLTVLRGQTGPMGAPGTLKGLLKAFTAAVKQAQTAEAADCLDIRPNLLLVASVESSLR